MSREQIHSLLDKWHQRIRATHKGHYKDAASLDKRQKALGTLVVVLSSVVGTGVFASLTVTNTDPNVSMVLGLLSVTAAALAALQTYLNFSAKQSTHIMAATRLSSLKKRIEEKLALEGDVEDLEKFLHAIRAEWDAITYGAPLMSERTFSKEVEPLLNPDLFKVPIQTDETD